MILISESNSVEQALCTTDSQQKMQRAPNTKPLQPHTAHRRLDYESVRVLADSGARSATGLANSQPSLMLYDPTSLPIDSQSDGAQGDS